MQGVQIKPKIFVEVAEFILKTIWGKITWIITKSINWRILLNEKIICIITRINNLFNRMTFITDHKVPFTGIQKMLEDSPLVSVIVIKRILDGFAYINK